MSHPHCNTHSQFEYDCIDCTDALMRSRGEVVVTTDESGRCVAVTRQDSEGRILSTIWEASEHRESPPDGGGGEAGGVCDCGSNSEKCAICTPPTPSAPVGVPDCVIVLLNHLEDLMDKEELAEDAIPVDMWNAVSMYNLTPASEHREVVSAATRGECNRNCDCVGPCKMEKQP